MENAVKEASKKYREAIDQTAAWMNGTTFSARRLVAISIVLQDAESALVTMRNEYGKANRAEVDIVSFNRAFIRVKVACFLAIDQINESNLD